VTRTHLRPDGAWGEKLNRGETAEGGVRDWLRVVGLLRLVGRILLCVSVVIDALSVPCSRLLWICLQHSAAQGAPLGEKQGGG
jgi:hypothetical protein